MRPGRVAAEQDAPDPDAVAAFRLPGEQTCLGFADQGVRASVVRLAPTVHGPGDHGFIPALIAAARRTGVSAYIGDGANRWPAVHRLDAAHLVALATATAPPGTVIHATAEEGIPAREIAEAIGRGLGIETTSIPAEQAAEHFGWIGAFFAADAPASSARTRARFGWEPAQPGLIADLDAGSYF
jgi:nucleoside-diphosphate-sugar epimerase